MRWLRRGNGPLQIPKIRPYRVGIGPYVRPQTGPRYDIYEDDDDDDMADSGEAAAA